MLWAHTLRFAATASMALVLLLAACGSGSSGPSEDSPQSRAALVKYGAYLEAKSALLVRAIQAMFAEIKEGDTPRAGSRYARARVRYGEVEPYASTFAKLDLDIDAKAGEVPASEFRGFHRIEKALGMDETTAGMVPVTRRLLEDTKELERRFGAGEPEAKDIVAGAKEVLAEMIDSELAGKEERYAHCDLVDVAANIEGADAAFQAIRPLLAADEDLSGEIESQLRRLYATVGEYGIFAREPEQARDLSPGVSFVIISELHEETIGEMRLEVEQLAELFSQVEARLA